MTCNVSQFSIFYNGKRGEEGRGGSKRFADTVCALPTLASGSFIISNNHKRWRVLVLSASAHSHNLLFRKATLKNNPLRKLSVSERYPTKHLLISLSLSLSTAAVVQFYTSFSLLSIDHSLLRNRGILTFSIVIQST